MNDVGWPTSSALDGILEQYEGAAVCVVPMVDAQGRRLGNNGDELMLGVFRKLLEQYRISQVAERDVATARAIFVPPNGALLQSYGFPDLLTAKLASLPDLPILVFPSSCNFPSRNPAELFARKSAGVTWVLREKNSFSQLAALWSAELTAAGVDLVLDHDVVATGRRFVPELLGVAPTRDFLLIAARHDNEARPIAASAVSRGAARPGIARSARAAIPRYVPQSRGRGVLFRAATARARRVDAEALLRQAVDRGAPQNLSVDRRHKYVDASSTLYATFRQFAALVAGADVVVTNRLHVALPAAIMGSQVYLVNSGYHKLSGVYERSLSSVPNVSLI